MAISKHTDFFEVVIKECSGKVQIESFTNGNKKLFNNCERFALFDLSSKDILHQLGVNLRQLVSVNLSHCNLTYLPNLFGTSNNLKHLNLSHNNLSEVPEMIYNALGTLEQLDLSYNKLTCFDGLPKCVYRLRILRLNNNCMTNIPDFVLKVCCLNLEELYYSHNEILGLSSSKFLYGGPYRLKRIELKNCVIRSADLNYLIHIRTLQEIDISNDNNNNRNSVEFSNTFENFFANAIWNDQLHILKLCDLRISDVPVSIRQLVNLQELYLSKNCIMWIPESIEILNELKVLDVSENDLISLPKNIIKLHKLEILKAGYNKISEIPDISCLSIKHLDLYDNCLENCCVFNCDIVVFLDLECNYFNTNDLLLKNYQEKKIALRQHLQDHRSDKSKMKENISFLGSDDEHYISEEENFEQDSIGEFKPGYVEECWSSATEGCDNGCTASDNEWTGSDLPITKQKLTKRQVCSPPSWMFIDIE